jgi:hypothetical protein
MSQRMWLGLGLAFAATVSIANTAQAKSLEAFCEKWHRVCTRCDGLGARVPRDECLSTCNSRKGNCLATGCYHFIRGGDRCKKS